MTKDAISVAFGPVLITESLIDNYQLLFGENHAGKCNIKKPEMCKILRAW